MMDRERRKSTTDDTIYRLYSMTKPITSVALMTLFEQGTFSRTIRCRDSFPRGGSQGVGLRRRRGDANCRAQKADDDAPRAESFGAACPTASTNHPVDRVYREVGVNRAAAGETLASFVEKLAKVPLR